MRIRSLIYSESRIRSKICRNFFTKVVGEKACHYLGKYYFFLKHILSRIARTQKDAEIILYIKTASLVITKSLVGRKIALDIAIHSINNINNPAKRNAAVILYETITSLFDSLHDSFQIIIHSGAIKIAPIIANIYKPAKAITF